MEYISLHPDKHPSWVEFTTRLDLTDDDVVTLYRILYFYMDVTRLGHRGLDDIIIHEIDKHKSMHLCKLLSKILSDRSKQPKKYRRTPTTNTDLDYDSIFAKYADDYKSSI